MSYQLFVPHDSGGNQNAVVSVECIKAMHRTSQLYARCTRASYLSDGRLKPASVGNGFTHVGVSYAEKARVLSRRTTITWTVRRWENTPIATRAVTTTGTTTRIETRYGRRARGKETGSGRRTIIGNMWTLRPRGNRTAATIIETRNGGRIEVGFLLFCMSKTLVS